MAKEIATLPPLAELKNEVRLSPRTGEPRRPALLVVSSVLLYLAVAAVAFSYGWHWYRAAFTESYMVSAHLTGWVEPEPGKWVSLFLEFVYAGLAGLAGAAAGVVGFHAWNGERWTRWGGMIALALAGVVATLVNLWGLIALGLVLLGVAGLFLPPVGRYFREWEQVRAEVAPTYRRPTSVFYGRLPRYR
jgi:hypothetical protein